MFTLVFHGADVFDSGDATILIEQLKPGNSLVAGIMARTAACESGLPVIYDGRRPSQILAELPFGQTILIHRAKTEVSAHRFGSIINSNLESRGLVMIDPGSCIILKWGDIHSHLCEWISNQTGYSVKEGKNHQGYNPDIRTIGGCLPGEPVFVNGIIIGYAEGEEAIITIRNGTLQAVDGITLKDHGVEKLFRYSCPDLKSAWCKSGSIRKSSPKKSRRELQKGKIAIIDHAATSFYDKLNPDICGILAIGDDTTSICGHIGCYRGIPVLGITDGDIDVIVPEGYATGSVVLEAIRERDDDLGKEIAALVPETPVIWDEWVDTIIRTLGNRVRIIHLETDSDYISV